MSTLNASTAVAALLSANIPVSPDQPRDPPAERSCGAGMSARDALAKQIKESLPRTPILNEEQRDEAIGGGYSNPAMLKMEKRGQFPPRIALSPRHTGWSTDEVALWLADRILNREMEQRIRSRAVRAGTAKREQRIATGETERRGGRPKKITRIESSGAGS